jgi:hypothetical protein
MVIKLQVLMVLAEIYTHIHKNTLTHIYTPLQLNVACDVTDPLIYRVFQEE